MCAFVELQISMADKALWADQLTAVHHDPEIIVRILGLIHTVSGMQSSIIYLRSSDGETREKNPHQGLYIE